jgi:hypothetical protein
MKILFQSQMWREILIATSAGKEFLRLITIRMIIFFTGGAVRATNPA